MNFNVHVTLWPSFPHFSSFAIDSRLKGIRLNSAMIGLPELDAEFGRLGPWVTTPLYFDIKGRQLRIEEVYPNPTHLDIRINHPIRVDLPTPVLFKAGEDSALLIEVKDGGKRLVFAPGMEYGPKNSVKAGESLHIRHSSMRTFGPQFTKKELDKIDRVKKAGFRRWYLSYVESKRDVDQFLELIGRDKEVFLKIENKKGLEYVAREFIKQDNLSLVAARGDMYVELDRPDDLLPAQELIISKDPEAIAGSRIMLSVIRSPVPSLADFEALAYLKTIGYRGILLCDEICLKGNLLNPAVNAVCDFAEKYAAPPPKSTGKILKFFMR